MAIVDDDMNVDSMRSLLNSLTCDQGDETLSPEVLAWADSCLIKDVDASDADWTSIKDALLEILSSQLDSPDNFSLAQSSMQLTAEPEESMASADFGGGSDKDEVFIDEDFTEIEHIDVSDEEEDDDGDDIIFRNKRGRVRGKTLGKSVFRPNYSEDIKVENIDSDLSSNLTTNDVDLSSDDIFKVWDLGITDEQDDFTKQLTKALADVPSQIQPNPVDSTALKDAMHVSIDDIISGIGDLSLNQYTI